MKIGINVRYLQNTYSGIENYLSNLILNLKKVDRDNEYILFLGKGKPVPEDVLETGFNYDISSIPTSNQLLKICWAHFYLPFKIKEKRIDLFHEPSFVQPIFKKCPTVITIHDLAYLHIPSCYTYRNRLYFKTLLNRSIKQSDLVITVSQSSKEDIIDNFRVSADKVQVVPLGISDFFRPLGEEKNLKKFNGRYNIRGAFILAVSVITARKNLITLIRAFKLLKERKQKFDMQLVIVGRKGWMYKDVFREVAALGLEKDVVFCGHVPLEQLLYLYNTAAMFVHASLYEGFGCPVLEAMACGCPVIASKVSSLPEVCGEAALLFDPINIEELTEIINRLQTDDLLRKKLIRKGLEQVTKFSWEKTAEKTLEVYKEFS